jgi:ABC-type sugar transport system substrate-binding protein
VALLGAGARTLTVAAATVPAYAAAAAIAAPADNTTAAIVPVITDRFTTTSST